MKKNIVLILCLIMLPLLSVFSIERVNTNYFLDGFTLNISKPYGFDKGTLSEDSFQIVSQKGEIVYGNIYYADYDFEDIKASIIIAARYLVMEEVDDGIEETISILPSDISEGVYGYWVYVTVGDKEMQIFAADLRRSPGGQAKYMFLYPDMDSADPGSLLGDVLSRIEIVFEEAAG